MLFFTPRKSTSSSYVLMFYMSMKKILEFSYDYIVKYVALKKLILLGYHNHK